MADRSPIERLTTTLSTRVGERRADPEGAGEDAPEERSGERPETDAGPDAVRTYTERDGRRAIYLERVGEDGRRRSIPSEDAIEAALWRETDLGRPEIPDVGEAIDRERLGALARGDVDQVALSVAGRRVIVSADGSVDVAPRWTLVGRLPSAAVRWAEHTLDRIASVPARASASDRVPPVGGDSQGTLEGLSARLRRRQGEAASRLRSHRASLRRRREALDAWLDEDVGPDPETVTAVETRVRDRAAESGGATTVVVDEGLGSLRRHLTAIGAALRRSASSVRSSPDDEPTGGDESDERASEDDRDRRNRSDAVTTRERSDGAREVVVERLDRDGGTREVPVDDAIEAALWRESDLGRTAIPDVPEEVDQSALLALARGDRETVTARLCGHVVALRDDGTVDVQAGPLTRCRRVLENARAMGDVDLSWDAVGVERDDESRGVFTRRATADADPEVFVERLDRHGSVREVPVDDAIEAALWRESDLERTAIPDVPEEGELEQLLALASADLEAVTVRLAGYMLLVHDDGRISVRKQAEADRRSVLKVASVAGVASTWGLAASGGTGNDENDGAGTDGSDESDASTGGEVTTTVRDGYGGATTTITTVTPDGTETTETIDHTSTEIGTETATQTATETDTDTATETAEETEAPAEPGGPNPPSNGTTNSSTEPTSQTATETATQTEGEAPKPAPSTPTEEADDEDDDYGQQLYGEKGYGGVPAN